MDGADNDPFAESLRLTTLAAEFGLGIDIKGSLVNGDVQVSEFFRECEDGAVSKVQFCRKEQGAEYVRLIDVESCARDKNGDNNGLGIDAGAEAS